MTGDFTEETATEAVINSFARTEDPRLREILDVVHAPPARVRPRRRADPGRVGGGDRFPDRGRCDVRREAPGVHPALRRDGGVDAGRRHQQPHPGRGHRVHRARPLPRGHLPAARARRRPRGRERGRAGAGPRAGAQTWTESRSPAPRSTSGTPTPTASTTCRRTTRPTRTCAGCSPPTPRGRFWFRTVLPSHYPIPDDGPVGDLLRRTSTPPLPPRAHPSDRGCCGPPSDHHPPVHRGQPLPRRRHGLRGEAEPDPPGHRRGRWQGDRLRRHPRVRLRPSGVPPVVE